MVAKPWNLDPGTEDEAKLLARELLCGALENTTVPRREDGEEAII